jgi:mono/diheme cytochrome c family protein
MLNIKSLKFFTTIIVFCLFASSVFAQADSTKAAATTGGGDAVNGETLFKANCAACHNPTEEASLGPGLKGVESRRDFAWIKPWVNNSQKVIASGDAYAVALFNANGKKVMTSFPTFGDKEVKDILAYVAAYKPPVLAGPTATGPTTTESSNGGMFQYLLIAILAIMVLVLFALLKMVNSLAKANNTSIDGANKISFIDNVIGHAKDLSKNGAVKAGIITLAILLLGKATIDGLYGIGIHQGYAPTQPIAFSHKLHAGDYKIDCNYCHTGAYKGKGANIPSANICMNCHNTIKQGSPEIQKIYRAIEKDEPIQWVRVHNLPDFAYFNHSQHTKVGAVECATCHGEVATMEVMQQRSSLTMGWCIDCHRKTNVNSEGNAYYDKLLAVHKKNNKGDMKVKDIGGLECSQCHY